MNNKDMLRNCNVSLSTRSNSKYFSEDTDSAHIKVKLDETLKNGVYLSLIAYPGNGTFDTDASVNRLLATVKVFHDDERVVNFGKHWLPLMPGYRVIAVLTVPLDEDYYLPVISNSIEVVDEEGNGAPQYIWPHISIDEEWLCTGENSAHFSFVADARILNSRKVSVAYCAYAYPVTEPFDLEASYMINLFSCFNVRETFEHQEIRFSEPVRSGYRVRAITYWTQCPEEFVPKGNDYEFGQPDNSIRVGK